LGGKALDLPAPTITFLSSGVSNVGEPACWRQLGSDGLLSIYCDILKFKTSFQRRALMS